MVLQFTPNLVTEPVVDQPLSEQLVNRLTRICPLLADVLDFERVRRHLVRNEVFSWTQEQKLMAEKVTYDRNVELIDNLQRGSLRSLLMATESLKDAECKRLGQYLLKGKCY